MRKTLPIIAAAVLSAACTGTTTPPGASAGTDSSVAFSSETPSSSSAMSSSSLAMSSASSSAVVLPSSSSEMSSSSSEAAADCSSVDVSAGKTAFNTAFNCTNCHNDYDQGTGLFLKKFSIAPDIDPNNIVHGGNLGLANYIATDMANCDGDATCIEKSEQIANYINSFSTNTEWCADLVGGSSSSSMGAEAKVIYAINVGATAAATFEGVTYEPAGPLSPTLSGAVNGTATIVGDITGTDEDALFQSQRYGEFTFELPVTAGEYNVTLFMAEDFAEARAVRIMSATAEGKVVFDNLDLFDIHGRLTAITYSINDVSVSDGSLTLDFTAIENYATIAGILVTSVDGAKGEIVVPPNPCEGTDNFVCLDFEDVQQGDIPGGWGYDGVSPVVDTAKARSGSKALKAQGMDYGSSGYITYPGIPSKHWGRMYYQMGANLQTTNYLHITLVELLPLDSGHAARVVDTNLANNDLSAMKYILNVDANGNEGGLESPTKFSYYDAVDKWVCVEWMVDPDTQKGALWADGELAYNDVLRHPSPNQIPSGSFDQIRIGMRTYKGARNTVWIDDVVVGPARIGCD